MYPQTIVSRPGLMSPVVSDTDFFIRSVKSITDDDIEAGEFVPEFSEKLLEPNGKLEMYSYSVSLLGTYTEDYIHYRVLDKSYFEKWDGIEDVDASLIPYEWMDDVNPVYLKGSLFKSRDIYWGNDKLCFSIVSCPTRCNFWHFQVSVYDNTGKLVKKSKSKWKMQLADKIISDILMYAVDMEKSIPVGLRS